MTKTTTWLSKAAVLLVCLTVAAALVLATVSGSADAKKKKKNRSNGGGIAGFALNSDLLDGLDSTAFLRSDGKAQDADKLDGKDSTDFAGSSIFAEVLGNGQLFTFNSAHAVSARRISTGIYEATFDRDVDDGCVHLAQSLDRDAFTTTTAGPRYLPSDTPQRERKVRVDQFDQAGNRVDGTIVMNIVCK